MNQYVMRVRQTQEMLKYITRNLFAQTTVAKIDYSCSGLSPPGYFVCNITTNGVTTTPISTEDVKKYKYTPLICCVVTFPPLITLRVT